MATTVDNSLGGTVGTAPSESSLEATARTGTVSVIAPDRSAYSATQVVRSLTTLEVPTGYHRGDTTQLSASLPPSGPWWARWYVWMPRLQDAGYGIDEVRWHVRFPDTGLGYVNHATAAGNIGSRLQPHDLAQGAILWDFEAGTSVPTGQWWRIEPHFDGTDLTVSVYPGHDTSGARVHTWYSRDVGRTMAVTGYRYHRDFSLAYGNTEFSQDVADYQNHIMTLGYPLPTWGADGFYGDEFADALEDFQADVGLPVGAGAAEGGVGPETCSAIDYGINTLNGTPSPPLYLSHLAVSDSGPLGPAAAPAGTASGTLDLGSAVTGTKAGRGTAMGTLSLTPDEGGTPAKAGTVKAETTVDTTGDGHKATAGTASGATTVTTTVTGHKQGHGTATGAIATTAVVEGTPGNRAQGLVEVTTRADGHKHTAGSVEAPVLLASEVVGRKHAHGTARGAITVTGVAAQIIEPIPAVSGTARAIGQLGGTAQPSGRLAGTVTRR